MIDNVKSALIFVIRQSVIRDSDGTSDELVKNYSFMKSLSTLLNFMIHKISRHPMFYLILINFSF